MTDSRPAAPLLGSPRPRVLPKPAADEAVDPIDTLLSQTPAAAPTVVSDVPVIVGTPATAEPPTAATVPEPAAVVPAPRAKVRRQEVFVQVGSRVTVETRDMLDDIIDREGISMRHALEKVIREYHAKG